MGRTGGTIAWSVTRNLRQARRVWQALRIACVLILLPYYSVYSQDLNALFTSSAGIITSKSADSTTDLQSFAQTLDLNWNKAISPVLRYRLTLRSEDTRNTIKVDSDVTRSSATQVEPVFDATLSSSAFSLNGGLRFRELFTNGNKQDPIWLNERRWFTRLFLTPQDLPTISFQIDRATRVNDAKPSGANQADTRYQVTTDYNYGGATFSYLFSDRIDQDFALGQTRDQKSNTGTFGYTGNSLWAGWLDILGGYSINYSPTREEFSKSGLAEVERPLTRGLKAAADLTPLDSTDVPLTPEPGLLNGTALIPLELHTSVGFEQPEQAADTCTSSSQKTDTCIFEIRLNLTPQSPFLIPDNLESFLTFKVFVSDDITLHTWTELSGFSAKYNALESRFEITWPDINSRSKARFFKVYVDANPFGAQIQVTRISAFNQTTVKAGEKRDRSILAHNLNGSFTLRPPGKLWSLSALSFDFNLSRVSQQPDSITNTTGTQTARMVLEPFRYLTSTFTYQHNFSTSNQQGSKGTTSDLYSVVFSSMPLPTLSSSLTVAHNDNRGDGELETRSDSGSLNVSTRLYRNLNVDSTYSLARTQDFLVDQRALSQGGTINANASLTPRLNSTLGYSIRLSQTEQPDQQINQLTHTISGSFTYTLSRLLNFNTRYDFLKGNDITSLIQDYRVDWTPTPKLSAFVDFRNTQQESSGTRS